MYLSLLPEQASGRHKTSHGRAHLFRIASLLAEVATSNHTKDLVNGNIRGQSAVEDGELPLESGRDVIAAASRMYHGCHELQVNNVCEVSWLLQAIKPLHLHQLTHYLICHLSNVWCMWEHA